MNGHYVILSMLLSISAIVVILGSLREILISWYKDSARNYVFPILWAILHVAALVFFVYLIWDTLSMVTTNSVVIEETRRLR